MPQTSVGQRPPCKLNSQENVENEDRDAEDEDEDDLLEVMNSLFVFIEVVNIPLAWRELCANESFLPFPLPPLCGLFTRGCLLSLA